MYGVVLWLGYGVTYAVFKQDWYAVVGSVAATYREAGMSAATADQITSYARRVVDVFAIHRPRGPGDDGGPRGRVHGRDWPT